MNCVHYLKVSTSLYKEVCFIIARHSVFQGSVFQGSVFQGSVGGGFAADRERVIFSGQTNTALLVVVLNTPKIHNIYTM